MNEASNSRPENPTSAQIGAAIRQLRVQRGLTIEGLANAAEMHSTYLSGIERGWGNPSWEKLRLVIDALEIDAAELVGLASTMTPGPARKRRRP